MITGYPRTDNYYAGKGCQCSAHDQSECGCDVDWTDARIYKLQAEVESLKKQLDSTKRLAFKFLKVLEKNGFKIEFPLSK